MNYYEHHLGDYLRDTAHLSMLEDGAYRRMLDVYYVKEQPLPAEPRDVYRLVRATSKPERDAVMTLLKEFFALDEDGWHHKRCDREIAKYQESAPDREAKREAERERQRRTRERRAQLFELLRSHGIVPVYDAPMSELQRLASRIESQHITRDGHAPVTRDNTATQSPDTSNQTPDTRHQESAHIAAVPAGEACKAMKAAGMADVNPSNPKLRSLLEAGITVDELTDAAVDAVQRQKGFGYALATAEGRRRDAVVAPLPGARAARPVAGETPYQRSMRERMQAVVPSIAARAPGSNDFIETEAHDVTPRRLG